jgi:predicted nicotinamide N-methyase
MLQSFAARFLALDRVPKFAPLELVDSEEKQIALLQRTILDPLAQRFPAPLTNRQDLLLAILRTCEQEKIPVDETVYALLASLLKMKPYNGDHFGIFQLARKNINFEVYGDSVAFVQAGSTGFLTWEAGKCLSWYLSTQVDLSDMTVLELGCGSGIAGIITAAHVPSLRQYTFTDYHESTLRQAQKNWGHNFEGDQNCSAEFVRLDIIDPASTVIDADYLVGADILFDEALCDGLVGLLESPKSRFQKALIVSTIRTDATYSRFIKKLDGSKILEWKNVIHSPLSKWIEMMQGQEWKTFLSSSIQSFDPVIELVTVWKRV